jgi:hypothetical protein
VPEYPRNDGGEKSGEKGGDDERHVKIRLKWQREIIACPVS